MESEAEKDSEIPRLIREAIRRPNRITSPFKWYGGKGNLAKWVNKYIPKTKVYVEPFAGAASMLFHRSPAPIEVLNDLHSDIVGLFRVLQDKEKFEKLAHRLTFTLYSREEFRLALAIEDEEGHSDIDRAWAFFVRQNQGFSGKATSEGNWGRMFDADAGWRSKLALLSWWHERLSRVQVDHCCALKCIRFWDSPDTCFYCDPPYTEESRTRVGDYKHEVTSSFHDDLVALLLQLQGSCVLSGYDSEQYQPLADSGWQIFKMETVCHAAGKTRGSGNQGAGAALNKFPRTEMLWVRCNHGERMLF